MRYGYEVQLRVLMPSVVYLLIPTSNHNVVGGVVARKKVVYLLIPTSNHNWCKSHDWIYLLYIFWFLHQTTTCRCFVPSVYSCISFDSYIKPQHDTLLLGSIICCISFDSYIKPQLSLNSSVSTPSCISFDSYIKPQPIDLKVLISSVYQSLFLIRNGE